MRPKLEELRQTLIRLDEAGGALSTTHESPILVAGTLWRCGSTLLQRIMMSDPRVLIWGEPIEDRAIVERLMEIITTPIQHQSHWIGDRNLSDLQISATHLLWPDASDLKGSMRAMFNTWLGDPARRRGFQEWGIKEVRWSGSDILFLRWLYPNARVFVIVRDPIEAYRSLLNYWYSAVGGYYVRWPDRLINSANSYATAWSEMVLSYLEVSQWEPYTLIDYQQLVEGAVDIPSIGRSCGLNLDPALALSARVNKGVFRKPITSAEREEILEITATARSKLSEYMDNIGRL